MYLSLRDFEQWKDFIQLKDIKFEVQIGGFTLIQQNGQRTYGGPPPNWGARPPPNRDCEVFIGRLPRTCFEDELIPLFLTAGELYEFRLMLDFSGTNRGYGYAHYATLEGAANAIKHLNKYEIKPGHQIGVLKSKNNCRLLFGNISSSSTKEGFESFIRSVTENVLEVVMFANYNELKKTAFNISMEVEEAYLARLPKYNSNSQFAIVEYENHKAAAVARRVLIPDYGTIFAIDWAVPPKERKRNITYENGDALIHNNNARAIQGIKSDLKTPLPRPVPSLLTGESIFDRITYIPPNIQGVVNYFKFLINEAIKSSTNRQEIPRQICGEIERKIIDRITNLENCGQAVQLLFNYFAWYNEKKPCVINPETQKILQEVKLFSDLFVGHILKKLNNEAVAPEIDEYYTTVLPTELNLIFKYAQTAVGADKEKFCGRITKSLEWLRKFAKLYTSVKSVAPRNVIVNQNQCKEVLPQLNGNFKQYNPLQNMEKQFEYKDTKPVNQNNMSAFSWNSVYSELRKIDEQKENFPIWENKANLRSSQVLTNNLEMYAPQAQGRDYFMKSNFYGENVLDQINGNISGRDIRVDENFKPQSNRNFVPVEYSHFNNNYNFNGVGFPRINCSQIVNFDSPQMMSVSPDSGISTDSEQFFYNIPRSGFEQNAAAECRIQNAAVRKD